MLLWLELDKMQNPVELYVTVPLTFSEFDKKIQNTTVWVTNITVDDSWMKCQVHKHQTPYSVASIRKGTIPQLGWKSAEFLFLRGLVIVPVW